MELRDVELIRVMGRAKAWLGAKWDVGAAARSGVTVGLAYALFYAVTVPGFGLEALIGKSGHLFGSLVIGGVVFALVASIRNLLVR
jgi:hypothetical protein